MASIRCSSSVQLASVVLLLHGMFLPAQSRHLTSGGLPALHRVKREVPALMQQRVEKAAEMAKEGLSLVKDVITVFDVLKRISKLASVAPGVIGIFGSIINFGLALAGENNPVLDAVEKGFEAVNSKLDSLSIQISHLATDVEWFNYASVYSQDEIRILNAWNKMNEVIYEKDSIKKLQLADIFVNYYEYTSTEASVLNVYHYLTVNGTSLSGNLNKLLMKKFRCKVLMVSEYSVYFSSLLMKGVTLNEFYWKLSGLQSPNKKAEHAQMFKNVYRAQLSAVEDCVTNSIDYIQSDVAQISKSHHPDKKKEIATELKEFLDTEYHWYDWVVVVYNKDKDRDHIVFNKRFFVDNLIIGVDHVHRGHSNTRLPDTVTKKIKECLKNCDTLPKCSWNEGNDGGLWSGPHPLSKFAKVTHATSSDREYAEVPQRLTYDVGKCLRKGSEYTVSLYYSKIFPVCKSNPCKNGGSCVRLRATNYERCECPMDYYGDYCTEKISEEILRSNHLTVLTKNQKLNYILNILRFKCPLKQ